MKNVGLINCLSTLKSANENGYYVEAISRAYAIFENRIKRLFSKIPELSDKDISKSSNSFKLRRRLELLKDLCNSKYPLFIKFDQTLIDEILEWMDDRNDCTHELIEKDDDQDVKRIALIGQALVRKLLNESNKVNYIIRKNPEIMTIKTLNQKMYVKCLSKKERIELSKV